VHSGFLFFVNRQMTTIIINLKMENLKQRIIYTVLTECHSIVRHIAAYLVRRFTSILNPLIMFRNERMVCQFS